MFHSITKFMFIKQGKAFSVILWSGFCALLVISFQIGPMLLAVEMVDIMEIEVVSDMPLYDPLAGSSIGRVVYFNNTSGGTISTTVSFSGTIPMTLTASPAFNHPMTSYTTTTTSPAWQTIVYTVTAGDGSQEGVQYEVVDGLGMTATAVISYIQDVTPPHPFTIDAPLGIGMLITSTSITTAVQFLGFVQDAGAGLLAVEVDTGMGYKPVTVNPSGTWVYDWMVPQADNEITYFSFRAVDNMTLTTTRTYTITVDNVAPTPPPITASLELTNTIHFEWSAASEPDTAGYIIHIYDNQNAVIDTVDMADKTEYAFVGVPGTYYATLQVYDSWGNISAEGSGSNPVLILPPDPPTYFAYLPAVKRPILPIVGEILFATDKGVTVFAAEVELNFANMIFPDGEPDDMLVWVASEVPPDENDWLDYVETGHVIELDTTIIGAQSIIVRFRKDGVEYPDVSGVVFYLPYGDFEGMSTTDLAKAGWTLMQNGLPVTAQNGQLTLGDPAIDCGQMPFPAHAGVQFNLSMPANTDYYLHVEARIFTYDQLPDPTAAVYDAFEVNIASNVTRFGNPVAPINCSTQRIVDVTEDSHHPFSLSPYQETIPIQLTNYSRFDRFYNTYTVIESIWVDD